MCGCWPFSKAHYDNEDPPLVYRFGWDGQRYAVDVVSKLSLRCFLLSVPFLGIPTRAVVSLHLPSKHTKGLAMACPLFLFLGLRDRKPAKASLERVIGISKASSRSDISSRIGSQCG